MTIRCLCNYFKFIISYAYYIHAYLTYYDHFRNLLILNFVECNRVDYFFVMLNWLKISPYVINLIVIDLTTYVEMNKSNDFDFNACNQKQKPCIERMLSTKSCHVTCCIFIESKNRITIQN